MNITIWGNRSVIPVTTIRTAMLSVLSAGLLIAALSGSVCIADPTAPGAYHQIARYAVGGDGFWDYLTCDSLGHRLFITRGTHVMVVSTDTGKVIGDIPDTKGCHGVALAPELKRGFVSDGGDNAITIFDLASLKTLAKVTVGTRPDAILYDPATRRVFTFNAGSQDTTAVDAATGKVVGTIALGGKPEFAQSDGAGKVFVNIEDKSELVTFDPKGLTVLKRTALAPGEEPSGLAINRAKHLLFAACGNKQAAVVDGATGKLVATPPIGDGPDAAAFDPGLGLAFTSNGEGTLSILKETAPGMFSVATVQTERGARTMALDPATHRIYLVTAKFTPPAAGERRPGMVPGSFVILVYGP
jgi:YVTN family beta-propeller protein